MSDDAMIAGLKSDTTTGHGLVGNLTAREYAMWQIKLHEGRLCGCVQSVLFSGCAMCAGQSDLQHVYVRIWDDIVSGT